MKKIGIILLLGLMMFAGCSKKEEFELKQIKLTQFFEMMDADEDFVVYFGTSSCSACLEYKPNVQKVVENYNITIYYVELDAESSDDKQWLMDEYIGTIEYTPTTYFIQSGGVVRKFVGTKGYRDLKNELVEYGFIKED